MDTSTNTSTNPSIATSTNPSGADPVQRLLDAIASGAGVPLDLFSQDAVLDATVPNWRFETYGGAAIGRELSNWYHDPATLEQVRRRPVAGGVAVEVDFSWEDGSVPHASHQLHLLTLDGDHIAADTVWCGGRWNAELLAQMEAARAH